MAAKKNSLPLPLIDDKPSFQLPPEKSCYLSASYKITATVKKLKNFIYNF
jgi:hypothetical protein